VIPVKVLFYWIYVNIVIGMRREEGGLAHKEEIDSWEKQSMN
jgi:hypothetical protein